MFERAKSFILFRSRKAKTNDELDENSHLRRTLDMTKVEQSNPNIYASLRITNSDLQTTPVKNNSRSKTASMEDVTLRTNTLTKISRHSLQAELASNNNDHHKMHAIEPYHRKSETLKSTSSFNEKRTRISNINPKEANKLAYETLERLQEKMSQEPQNVNSKSDFLKDRLTRQRTDLNIRNKTQKQKRYSGGDFIVMSSTSINELNDNTKRLSQTYNENKCSTASINTADSKAIEMNHNSGQVASIADAANNEFEIVEVNNNVIKNINESQHTEKAIQSRKIAAVKNATKEHAMATKTTTSIINNHNATRIKTRNAIEEISTTTTANNNNNTNNVLVDGVRYAPLYVRPAPKMGTKALFIRGPKNLLVEEAQNDSLRRDVLLMESVQKSAHRSSNMDLFVRNQFGVRRSLQEGNAKKSSSSQGYVSQGFVKSKSFIYKPTKGLKNILQE